MRRQQSLLRYFHTLTYGMSHPEDNVLPLQVPELSQSVGVKELELSSLLAVPSLPRSLLAGRLESFFFFSVDRVEFFLIPDVNDGGGAITDISRKQFATT